MSKTYYTINNRQRALALALALLLCLCLLPSPARAEGSSVTISTADELKDFLKSCALDSYSKGLSATLTANIDLRGDALSPASIFYGSFDGGGFSITGFTLKAKGSKFGLFRSLEKGSVVSDLNLRGEIAPGGSACCVGMLCGENRGTINGCSVSGSVSGVDDVGGIAGVNAAEGKITSSTSDARITGSLRVGGIAGSNAGVIEASKSSGDVSVPSDVEPAQKTEVVISVESSPAPSQGEQESSPEDSPEPEEAKEPDPDAVAAADMGGITGLNQGAVRGCANQGSVGHASVSNVGGIAGRHSGIIFSCENDGAVCGGKDVGGIVGRFEPHMAISSNASSAAELKSKVSSLTGTLRALTALLSSASGEAQKSAATISTAVSAIEKALQSDAAVSDSAATVDSMSGNVQIISSATQKVSAAVSDFSAVSNAELPAITSQLQTISAALEEAGVSSEAESIIAQSDSFTAKLGELSAALTGLQALTASITEALQKENATQQEKSESIGALLEEYYAAADENALSDALKSISASVSSISASVKAINGKLSKSSAVIVQSMQLVGASAGKLGKAASALSSGATTQSSIISANMAKVVNLLYGFTGSAAIQLEASLGTIYTQLCIVSAAVNDLITTADATDVDIYNQLSGSIDGLGAVSQCLLSSADAPLYSTVDVAENIAQSELSGEIASCLNNGAVSADENAGGIAGIMTLKAADETGGATQSSAWTDSAALFRAILMTSSNNAPVIAKAGCAGGIAGRCDLGAIYSSASSAAVEVTDGGYCGGVAGLSRGSIISCDALCDLTGNDYVGGIAGQGAHLSDCRAMVRLFSDGESTGAIAGDADGDILGNVFVDEGMQGICGVSYAGVAEPMAYKDFIELEFINPIFTDLNANFYIDGKLVKRVPLTYGGSIKSSDIPSIPPHEDGFGQWERFNSESTLRSMDINARFTPWLTTLYSAGEPALLYAEGEFSDKGSIEIEDTTPKLSLSEASRLLSSCTYSVFDPVAPAADQYKLHLLCEQKGDISVTLVTENGKRKLPSKRDGSYLVFDAPASGKLEIRQSQTRKVLLAIFIILVVLILLCFYIYMQKHFPGDEKPKSEPKPPKKEKKPRKPPKEKAKGRRSGKKVKKLIQSGAKKAHETAEKRSKAAKPAPKKRSAKKKVLPAEEDQPPYNIPVSPAVQPSEAPSGSRLNISIGEDGIDRRV